MVYNEEHPAPEGGAWTAALGADLGGEAAAGAGQGQKSEAERLLAQLRELSAVQSAEETSSRRAPAVLLDDLWSQSAMEILQFAQVVKELEARGLAMVDRGQGRETITLARPAPLRH